MKNPVYGFIVLLLVALSFNISYAGTGTVKDGVINMSILIEDNVPESADMISEIQKTFKDSSKYLYDATHKQNRYGTITIYIPSTWGTITGAQAIGNQDTDNADIRIKKKNMANAYVSTFGKKLGSGGCINLGYERFGVQATLKSTIVHELGHYAYGLYDEYMKSARKNGSWYKIFWDKEGGWIKCSSRVTFTVYPHEVEWSESYSNWPYRPSSPSDNYTSIMWNHHISPISEFCYTKYKDHNTNCNSEQNLKHDFLSCWEVMVAKKEFGLKLPDDSNIGSITYSEPTFQLLQAEKGTFSTKTPVITVKTYVLAPGKAVEEKFPIDSTIRETKYTVACRDSKFIDFSFTNPKGIEITSANSRGASFEKEKTSIACSVKKPLSGEWALSITNKGNSSQDITLTVEEGAKRIDGRETQIDLEGGTYETSYQEPEPIHITASLNYDYTPVQNAVVKAIVRRPDGTEVEVHLSDNGTSGNDQPMQGVYEGYFTQINGNGAYNFTLVADNSNKKATAGIGFNDTEANDNITPGTQVEQITQITEAFTRQTALPPVQVSGYTGNQAFPPGEIEQFEVEVKDDKSFYFTWVATGDNEYDGKASSYELRYSSSPIQTEDEWKNAKQITGLPVPKMSGEDESFATQPFPLATYYFVLRAKSSAGLYSLPVSVMASTISDMTDSTSSVMSAGASDNGGKNGCFIATAAFGSPLDSHVVSLQRFRDRFLLTNIAGRFFVNAYYSLSPALAIGISHSPALKGVTRAMLVPVVFTVENPLQSFIVMAVIMNTILGLVLHLKRRRVLKKVPLRIKD